MLQANSSTNSKPYPLLSKNKKSRLLDKEASFEEVAEAAVSREHLTSTDRFEKAVCITRPTCMCSVRTL